MSKQRSAIRPLTDLEAVVIAFVYRRQPCTPYKIRQSFEKSTTTRFSSSAGSIYPLVKRLADRGDLIAGETPGDGRKSCNYRVTAKGLRRARAWLNGLDDAAQIGVYDPIRSRLTNLNLLSDKQQLDWLDDMIALLEQQQELIRSYESRPFVGDQRLHEAARQSLWAENRVRIHWLREIRDTLKDSQDVA